MIYHALKLEDGGWVAGSSLDTTHISLDETTPATASFAVNADRCDTRYDFILSGGQYYAQTFGNYYPVRRTIFLSGGQYYAQTFGNYYGKLIRVSSLIEEP
jgi:hypothetical protein